MSELPGGAIASRPLHFIWILDTSSSMSGEKIGQLNFAIKEALPAMQDVARDNPNADVLVRVVTFSSGAQWHWPNATPVDQFSWVDVSAGGVTDMGKGLSLVADQLKMPPMSDRALPPVLVLITDGYPTDDFKSGLNKLMKQPWGQKAVRLAIGLGSDAGFDVLDKFIGHGEIKALRADNAATLVKFIKWASTAVVQAASSPVSQPKVDMDKPQPGPQLPKAPEQQPAGDGEVW